jgi:shikimate kinase
VINFFGKYDEAAFRNIETNMLKKTLDLSKHVISTGGGTPCFNNNMDLIKKHGFSVYIQMHPHSLFVRLKHAKRLRPRTSFLNDDDLRKRITDDLELREKFYLQADFDIKGENIDIDKLAEVLREMIAL